MGETPERTKENGAGPDGYAAPPHLERPRLIVTLVLLFAAAACYAGIVTARLGPPSGGDTVPLTSVTSALADGDLRAAASAASLPNPPGYPLLAAPFVAAFPSAVGSPSWCTPSGRINHGVVDRHERADDPARAVECGANDTAAVLPPWYRAQGLLGVTAWLVLATGALALLRAARADTLARQAGLLAFLAILPAASSAVVQLYHPQDVVSLGLSLAGLASVLRRRWLLAGVLFGVAVLTKQFAVLLLLPALAAAPDRRSRLWVGGSALAVFAAGILPFLVVDPQATLENLSGFSAGGAAAGQTVLTVAGVHGTVASAVARDAPLVFALVVCVWVHRRLGPRIGCPETLVALALVCTGSRLVFESVIFPYYLLAASVLVLLLDLVARRSPHWSLTWCAAAAFFVALHPGNRAVAAFGTLFLAVAVVALGCRPLLGAHRAPVHADPSAVP
jgi:Glycosyltransferase family 87